MPAVTPSKLMEMSRSADPKQAIWDAVGKKIEAIKVYGSWILVGTYIEPERTAGGIIKPNKTVEESLWQGCVGLVLKKGPQAFTDDDLHKFAGQDVEVNDWVMFRFSSAWEFHLNGVSVRLVPDVEIRAVIDHPDTIASKPHITFA